jgi:hypothetical protein
LTRDERDPVELGAEWISEEVLDSYGVICINLAIWTGHCLIYHVLPIIAYKFEVVYRHDDK